MLHKGLTTVFFFFPSQSAFETVVIHTFWRLFLLLRLHGVNELINQPVEQMMNSENEDSKDANAEGNDLNSFDVLGRKIYLMSFHSKTKAQKIPTDCYPAGRLLFIYLFIYFVCFSYEVLRVACQLLRVWWSPRERLSKCHGITARWGRGVLPIMALIQGGSARKGHLTSYNPKIKVQKISSYFQRTFNLWWIPFCP